MPTNPLPPPPTSTEKKDISWGDYAAYILVATPVRNDLWRPPLCWNFSAYRLFQELKFVKYRYQMEWPIVLLHFYLSFSTWGVCRMPMHPIFILVWGFPRHNAPIILCLNIHGWICVLVYIFWMWWKPASKLENKGKQKKNVYQHLPPKRKGAATCWLEKFWIKLG